MQRTLVTGGCGFIGSHLVDSLMKEGNQVDIVDKLSSGDVQNLKQWETRSSLEIIKQDLTDSLSISEECETVYHLAANTDVRIGSSSPKIHFDQNILATYNLLEAVRKSNTSLFVFSSTSTVYGEAKVMPTPEAYGPLKPISTYGASKLACEALISAYAYTYGFKAIIYRLANVIGTRSTHGIIYDFLQKLKEDCSELEILGDGSQTKSYIHVSDCVAGILIGARMATDGLSIFNIGSEDQINVMRIAEIVCRDAGLDNVTYKFSPATTDGRGWPGDVRLMRLDVSDLKSLGWKPRMNSEEAVKLTVRELLEKDSAETVVFA